MTKGDGSRFMGDVCSRDARAKRSRERYGDKMNGTFNGILLRDITSLETTHGGMTFRHEGEHKTDLGGLRLCGALALFSFCEFANVRDTAGMNILPFGDEMNVRRAIRKAD